jgi:pSer/pThr/pTyr-binding forkhead associated (FHA) protein
MSMAKLRIREPGAREREVEFAAATSIGREPDNAVCLRTPGVAPYHAVIERSESAFWLSDLGGGTTVAGRRVGREFRLRSGDTIVVGDATIEFVTANEEPSLQSSGKSDSARETRPRPSPALVAAGLAIGLVVTAGVAYAFLSATAAPAAPAAAKPVETEPESEIGTNSKPSPSPVAAARIAPETRPSDDTDELASRLATQISQKSGYRISPEFADRIRTHVDDYRGGGGDARRYRLAVNKAFAAQGVPPLVGYVTAMSQSRFVDGTAPGDIWRLPDSVARTYAGGGGAAADRSAEVAAAYLKDLLSQFDPDDFMYALACYGKPLADAAELRARLEAAAPDPAARLDFWRLVEAGIVPRDGAEQVARFFAAGIVGENPEAFGLQEKRLSSLY